MCLFLVDLYIFRFRFFRSIVLLLSCICIITAIAFRYTRVVLDSL